jgi:methyl-accepting chemotaxis protein
VIEDSVHKIDHGTKLSAKAGITMQEILGAIRGLTDKMIEKTAASVDQSAGIQQVNLAIVQMDVVTQQNAALVEQAAAAAESLQAQAQALAVTVNGFTMPGQNDGLYDAENIATVPQRQLPLPHHHRRQGEYVISDFRRVHRSHVHQPIEAEAANKPQLLAVLPMGIGEF